MWLVVGINESINVASTYELTGTEVYSNMEPLTQACLVRYNTSVHSLMNRPNGRICQRCFDQQLSWSSKQDIKGIVQDSSQVCSLGADPLSDCGHVGTREAVEWRDSTI